MNWKIKGKEREKNWKRTGNKGTGTGNNVESGEEAGNKGKGTGKKGKRKGKELEKNWKRKGSGLPLLNWK